jgi:hypothetical protein
MVADVPVIAVAGSVDSVGSAVVAAPAGKAPTSIRPRAAVMPVTLVSSLLMLFSPRGKNVVEL